jgi:hypothetical protein
MKQVQNLAFACGVLLALACGGDSDDGDDDNGGGGTPGEIDSGLAESTRIDSLTPQQYTSACESLRDDVAARLGPDITTRGSCEVYSAAIVDDPAQCRTSADTCVGQVNNDTQPFIKREDIDFTTVECGSDTSELQGCSATMGEVEACLRDRVTGIEGLLAANDCDNAASVGLEDAQALTVAIGMVPASCTSLQAKCPGFDLGAPPP